MSALPLKQLEDENAKLKKLVADLSLDREMLQDVTRRRRCRLSLVFKTSKPSVRSVAPLHHLPRNMCGLGDAEWNVRNLVPGAVLD